MQPIIEQPATAHVATAEQPAAANIAAAEQASISDTSTTTPTDGEVNLARCFLDTFVPKEGVDYTEVLKFAKSEYQSAEEGFKNAEAKATSLASYTSAGTGFLAVASIAGSSFATLDPWVLLAGMPAFACAILSLICAIRVKAPMEHPSPYHVRTAVSYAEHDAYQTVDKAQAAMIGQWNLATEIIYASVERKNDGILLSIRLYVVATALLALPLLVAFARKV